MPKQLNEQKFCGWCSTETTYKSEWMSECPNCGYKKYFNPKPGCNLMIARGNKLLMVQRSIEPKFGKFDFPGGFMDMSDSSMEESVYREVNEELGLSKSDFTELKYLGSGTEPYEWCDTLLNVACFFYVGKIKDTVTEIKVRSENSATRWITENDLPNIDFAWNIDRKMLRKYYEEINV